MKKIAYNCSLSNMHVLKVLALNIVTQISQQQCAIPSSIVQKFSRSFPYVLRHIKDFFQEKALEWSPEQLEMGVADGVS